MRSMLIQDNDNNSAVLNFSGLLSQHLKRPDQVRDCKYSERQIRRTVTDWILRSHYRIHHITEISIISHSCLVFSVTDNVHVTSRVHTNHHCLLATQFNSNRKNKTMLNTSCFLHIAPHRMNSNYNHVRAETTRTLAKRVNIIVEKLIQCQTICRQQRIPKHFRLSRGRGECKS